MHDLVHDLAISLLGDEILDQSKQGNTEGSSCLYALLTDCRKPLGSCLVSPATLSALHFLDCRWTELHGAAFEPAESLQVLDLSECLIHKLPDSIDQLKQLRYLNAPRIRYHMVPECITKLSNLIYLSFHGSCALMALPESIGEMEGLVHLDLSGCVRIEKLPESFGDLKSLEHVDFTDCNNVTGVSECLARLTKLQYLKLSNCTNIGDLPRALGRLTELQYLNLSGSSYLSRNKLDGAEFLGSLTKLKYLNLSSGNSVNTIRLPEALGSLTQLKYLNLSRHFIVEKLPVSFGNLCNLEHIDLSWCSFLQDVPAAIDGFTKLQYLDLCACSCFNAMEEQQEVFGNLRELRQLNLGRCIGSIYASNQVKINSFLEQIFTLTNLEYLSLRENDSIYSVPETVVNLRKLHTLDLSWCCKLERLPTCISEIDSLKFLYTDNCWMLDGSTLPRHMSCSRIPPHTGDGESSSYHFQFEEGNPACLNVTRLENVKSAKETQTIKLVEKTDITQLALAWTTDGKRFMDDTEVLRELEPPYSVLEFRLEGYNSISFPSWVMLIDSYLPYLTRIEILDLPNCHNLPPLGQLLNLKYLEIRRVDSIKKIEADLFPRLEEVLLDGMKCLEEWITAYSSDDGGLSKPVLPCLRHVVIRQCPRLRFNPCLPPSIDTLLVESSNEVMLSNHVVGVSATTRLHVECCPVPLQQWSLLGQLPSLERLRIINCSDLTCGSSDLLRGLTSLQTLTVRDCRSIISLLERLGDLTSLTKLEIGLCRGIKTAGHHTETHPLAPLRDLWMP
ncbi:unnamed protein product [Urochloa humidicola]